MYTHVPAAMLSCANTDMPKRRDAKQMQGVEVDGCLRQLQLEQAPTAILSCGNTNTPKRRDAKQMQGVEVDGCLRQLQLEQAPAGRKPPLASPVAAAQCKIDFGRSSYRGIARCLHPCWTW